VVIFGAGYDAAAEDRPFDTETATYGPPEASSTTMGRGVFVLNAKTGGVIKRFGPDEGMTHSVPSDVAVLSDRYSGLAQRAYAADTGGELWRINFAGADPAGWTVTKLATLAGTGANARKFLYPPDVVGLDEGGYAVLLGSGDREHPFDTLVKNRFYMVKDVPGGGYPIECTGDTDADPTCALSDATTSSIIPGDAKGWYIELGEGEKVVGSAVTLAGTTFFPTNQPDPESCTANLGKARIYGVDFENGSATMFLTAGEPPEKTRSMEVPGGGFPPSPVPVLVEIDGEYHQGVISGPTVVTPPGLKLEKRSLIWWYKEGVD
jgi:type IV pilus assembly protein PilY1